MNVTRFIDRVMRYAPCCKPRNGRSSWFWQCWIASSIQASTMISRWNIRNARIGRPNLSCPLMPILPKEPSGKKAITGMHWTTYVKNFEHATSTILKETMKIRLLTLAGLTISFAVADLCPANKHVGYDQHSDAVRNDNTEYANHKGNKLFWNPLLVGHAESLSSRSSPCRPGNQSVGNLWGKGE